MPLRFYQPYRQLQGPGGGQVVSVLAFSSDDPSSNRADVIQFLACKLFEKNENKQEEDGDVSYF